MAPINLIIETEMHRATPGGTGGVKTIGNYAAVCDFCVDYFIVMLVIYLFITCLQYWLLSVFSNFEYFSPLPV